MVPTPTISESPPKVQDNEKESEGSPSSSSDSEESQKIDKKKLKKKNKKKKQKEKSKQNKSKADPDKLEEALKNEEESQQLANKLLSIDERKRPYNSMFEVKKPTEEEMEAYYLKRRRDEDPMNAFI